MQASANYGIFKVVNYTITFFIIVLNLAGCRSDYSPKPRGYFKIALPQRGYQHFNNSECPFSFDYPKYGKINRDTIFFDTIPDNPCWLNISFPLLNGNLYLSYKRIGGKNSLDRLINDSHELTYKHTVKADYINENLLSTPNHVHGILYEVGGNAASEIQFFVTDSVEHFLRGSLYFYNTPNADSIAPAVNFLKPDIIELIRTLRWKESDNE
ncbi:MAG: gliding motility lipoprotein GldD [Chitinophagales bacterium]|nr:gliding motility lipoprotein GldD [Chitinophagales bacterium]